MTMTTLEILTLLGLLVTVAYNAFSVAWKLRGKKK